MNSRQQLIAGWDQAALQSCHANVVGAGALGSILAISLARLGVGELTIIDPDVLEPHNLENQAYTRSHLGSTKVSALADIISSITSMTRVHQQASRFQNADRKAADIMLGCVDNFETRHWLSYASVQERVPYIDGGIDSHRGVVRLLQPSNTPCHDCYDTEPPQKLEASCSLQPIPSTFVTASVTANVMANTLRQLRHGESPPSHTHIDLRIPVIRVFNMIPNPECIICGPNNA